MALTLPYSTLSSTSDKSEIEQNFTAVANKFGSITNADISDLDSSKLSARNYDVVLQYNVVGTALNTAATGTWVIGGIPYDSTQGAVTYTIVAVEHMTYCLAGATTAAVMTLQVGHTNTFSAVKSDITTSIAAGGAQTAESGFSTSFTTSATQPVWFILDITTAGAGYAANDGWAICIKLKQVLRA